MKKIILIAAISTMFTGCYSCGEAMARYYDSCMNDRHDKEFCMKSSEMEAQTMGYCTTTSVDFGFNYNTNTNYNYYRKY